MLKNSSVVKLTKRVLILGLVLMMGAAVMMFGSPDLLSGDRVLIPILVVVSVFAFFFLVWPAIGEAEKVIEEREEDEDEMFP